MSNAGEKKYGDKGTRMKRGDYSKEMQAKIAEIEERVRRKMERGEL